MKIIHISDTHTKHQRIRWPFNPAEADMIIHSGDISNVGSRWDVEEFITWLTFLPVKHKIFIAGNHDLSFDPHRGGNEGDKPKWLYTLIERFEAMSPTNKYLENESFDVEGIKIWGSPITPWFHGTTWAFNMHRGPEQIGMVWNQLEPGIDIVVTHGPVYGIHDFTQMDQKLVGCEDLRFHVKRIKPLLHLSGHIHEGYGYEEHDGTHYFNGSNCALSYEPINEPWLIDVDFTEKTVNILNEKHKSNV